MKHEKLCEKYGISIPPQTMEELAELVFQDIEQTGALLPNQLLSLDKLVICYSTPREIARCSEQEGLV